MMAYFAESETLHGPNEAHQYHPHSSLTGFFTLHKSSSVVFFFRVSVVCSWVAVSRSGSSETLHKIIDYFDSSVGAHPAIPVPNPTRVQRHPHNISSLVISLETPQFYYHLIQKFKAMMKVMRVEVRTKPIDHLSLAYFKSFPNKALSGPELDRLTQLASEMFAHPLDRDLGWNLVLQQQVYKSEEIGKPHIFRPVKTWRIN
jgi:hypothetical protein